MDTLIKERLKKILQEIFKGSWELGGGLEFRYKHGTEVANFSLRIAKAEKLRVDLDALYVAALFHDIGKAGAMDNNGQIDYQSEANKSYENISGNFLKKYIGNIVDDKTIEKAVKIINEELNENPSIERKAIKDADELGNFGYSQVWRTINYIALNRQSFAEMVEFWESGHLEKRRKWIDQLSYDVSKRVALKRYKKFVDFIQEIKKESLGEDII
jgi:putative nucleotidyltransferase with HDIG domain